MLQLTDEELHIGLQYSLTNGLPALREWMFELQERIHGRHKGEGWTISIGAGATDMIFKVGYPRAILEDGIVHLFLGRQCTYEPWGCYSG